MGAVYRARQRALDRWVALKILRSDLDTDPGFAERFTREARALALLNHPGIVTLYEFGRSDAGRYFILMELVDGVNLRQLLAAGRLAPREALAIVPPLCDALQYAHDRGLVHRDIKPENILVDRLGRVKVADFGIARLAEPKGSDGDFLAGSEGSGFVGTPAYMAPEQRERPDRVDHRADLYALGVVLYQMLTGELPAAGVIPPPSHRVQLDVRLDAIVLRALEVRPERRYGAADEFKTEVQTVVATPSPDSHVPLEEKGQKSEGGTTSPSAAAGYPNLVSSHRQGLAVPAVGLLISATFQVLAVHGLLGTFLGVHGDIGSFPEMESLKTSLLHFTYFLVALGLISAGVTVLGALQMLKGRRNGWAVAGAISAIVIVQGAGLGLVFGVWALVKIFQKNTPPPIPAEAKP